MNIEDAQFQEAYLKAHYRVTEHTPPFVLRIGQVSPEVLAVFRSRGVVSAAFVTAWNPFSEMVSQETNDRAQRKMEARLTADGYVLISGGGVDPSGEWAGEESVLALGMSREAAAGVGREFGQNAVVWVGSDGVPELVWLGRGAGRPE